MNERLYSTDLSCEEMSYINQVWHLSRMHSNDRYNRLIYVLTWFLHKYPIYEDRRLSIYKIIDEETQLFKPRYKWIKYV